MHWKIIDVLRLATCAQGTAPKNTTVATLI